MRSRGPPPPGLPRASGSARSHQRRLVDEGGQGDVTLGQTPAVVRAECDLDLQQEAERNEAAASLIRCRFAATLRLGQLCQR